ncbi:hypothetical protein ASG88_14445 [Nocardioides sp. Soil777]|uniref:hypothetical protein n=1 Tax=Nocardioides sp. Soil777 TaxID=1736409 RepID=UPI000702CBA3|nr:hypothetical protein [Nocardioides sp. Soil777]KRE99792.1 hypothetical protein ASG88_14445 [Nocardioides sp. Soil777]
MDTLNADGIWDRLGSIALLLHQAATQVWSDADRSAVDSPLHDLGLGVYLAHSQASALLPDDYELPEVTRTRSSRSARRCSCSPRPRS